MAAPSQAVVALLGADVAPFEMLIKQLMSPSNEERGQAEVLLNECKQHPDPLVTKLVQMLRGSQVQEARAMCAILLRKVMTKDEVSLWPQLSPPTQQGVKQELLQCVLNEEVPTISKKLCDTVTELSTLLLESNSWPELLPFVFQCAQSPTDRHRWAALLIFSQLATYSGDALYPYLGVLHGVFHSGLTCQTSSDVRIAALRAATCFVQTLESSSDRDRFQDLVPPMLQTLEVALTTNEEAAAQEALDMFIEVAGTEPRFLRRQLAPVVAAMLSIAEAEALDESLRHLAIEFLVTLAEARDKAPGMMRKLPDMVGRLFAVLLKLLVDLEDDPAWYAAEDDNDDCEDSTNYDAGMDYLDRLAIAMGGTTVLQFAGKMIPPYLQSNDWVQRHAGLIALAQIAEGCSKVMVKSYLEPVMNMVLSAFNDPHPRVRWAAINATGQMATDLGPFLQKKMHAKVMPALMGALGDFQNPRVQAHASSALLNFSEEASPELLAPYLDVLIDKLLQLLRSGKSMVQESVLTALASVADCAQDQFVKYYDVVIPYLKNILLNANDKAHRMLRAKSMECISLVGMAVGKDKFRNDAKEVMDVLMKLQVLEMDDDDPTISYMLQAWARLCKCLGQEFLPYLSVVMPPLLKSAQLKPDVTIADAGSDDEAEEDEDEDIETIQIGDKRIGIRTSVLEEKATACNMLCCYADELKEGFFPYVDAVAPILVPQLKFYFHEEVRKAAVQALPELYRSAKLAIEKGTAGDKDASYLKQLADYLTNPLIEALEKEPETEVKAEMLEALSDLVTDAGQLLDPSHVSTLVVRLKECIEECSRNKQDRATRAKSEDFDEEEGELMEEEDEKDDEVLEQVQVCLGSLIKVYKEGIMPLLEGLFPHVLTLVGSKKSAEERRIAICILDDIIEFGAGQAKYFDTIFPHLLNACSDKDADVRQAAVYGVGICAQCCPDKMRPFCGEVLPRLNQLVSSPGARSEDNEMVFDNAVAAIGKIITFLRDAVDARVVVPGWLSLLPVTADKVEAKLMHEQLCTMLEKSDPALLGENHQNVPKILAVLSEVLSQPDLVADPVRYRIVALLRNMQTSLPADALSATWATLQPKQQAALQKALSTPAS